MMKESCIDIFDAVTCNAAGEFCGDQLAQPVIRAGESPSVASLKNNLNGSGLNPYDISKSCEGQFEDTFCYPITKYALSQIRL